MVQCREGQRRMALDFMFVAVGVSISLFWVSQSTFPITTSAKPVLQTHPSLPDVKTGPRIPDLLCYLQLSFWGEVG